MDAGTNRASADPAELRGRGTASSRRYFSFGWVGVRGW
jgi:hypothetical protein